MAAPLPYPSILTKLSADKHAVVIRQLFEDSDLLISLVQPLLATNIYLDYGKFIEDVDEALLKLLPSHVSQYQSDSHDAASTDVDKLDAILSAHPRLGAKNINSAHSRAEQGNLTLESVDQAKELEELQRLNGEYEKAFGGLGYLVFVNGRGRSEILDDMRRRIDRGNIWQERAEGIHALVAIAQDRASKAPLESTS